MDNHNFSKEEWETCIKVLSELKNDPFNNPDNELFSGLIVKIHKAAKKLKRNKNTQERNQIDLDTLARSTISNLALNNKTTYSPGVKQTQHTDRVLNKSRHCYACNALYKHVHSFYSRMCPVCAQENYDHRFDAIDLRGRHVIITGGRVKLGYSTALKCLRNGAIVIVTTRFPGLALDQFKKEKDFKNWKDNLTLYGLDLRNLKAVETFVEYVKSNFESLDVLINNAAQTIKYTDTYYSPLVQQEEQEIARNIDNVKLVPNTTSVFQETQIITSNKTFEELGLNRFGQPIDNRLKTSWNSTLEEISMYELLEVNLINQISPYFLIKELTSWLKKSKFPQRFIINVTSSEGQFSYLNKTVYHPHTNMTKAALNMLTRTSAKAYEVDRIYMYAVDVGWISTGAKEELREKQFSKGYIPPLDSVDGAARIMHPIIEGIKEKPILVGVLLKNYKIEQW